MSEWGGNLGAGGTGGGGDGCSFFFLYKHQHTHFVALHVMSYMDIILVQTHTFSLSPCVYVWVFLLGFLLK